MKLVILYVAFACISVAAIIFSLPVIYLFKISIERIGVFLSPIFNLAEFKVQGYEVKIGWLPISSYVKVKEMILSDGDYVSDKSFVLLKSWQKLFVYLSMPIAILSFLLLLQIYTGNGVLGAGPIIVIAGLIIIIKCLDIKNHNRKNSIYIEEDVRVIDYILSLVIYLGILTVFGSTVYIAYFNNGPLAEYFNNNAVKGDVSIANAFYKYTLIIGLFCVTSNMLPLSAMPGAKTVDLIYESFSKKNLPSKFQSQISLYGLPIILIAWLWLFKLLIFDIT